MHVYNVWRYYSCAPFFTKCFIVLRWLSCPFQQFIEKIPSKGSVLDIGCGYGLLILYLAKRNPYQHIVGIDLDTERIKVARKAFSSFHHISFQNNLSEEMSHGTLYRCIAIIDVLYLLPPKAKVDLLKLAYKLLKPGGKLHIKINNKSFSVRYFLTWIQEKVTVQFLRKTETKYHGLFFENTDELCQWLKECGYKIEQVVKLPTPFPFFHPHNLIIAVK